MLPSGWLCAEKEDAKLGLPAEAFWHSCILLGFGFLFFSFF